jgi:uncharacterized damage-inducible protein DinB
MPRTTHPTPSDCREILLETYAANGEMNQLLLQHIDRRAWRSKLDATRREGRTIAAIFAHMHNCRLVWLKNSASYLKCPAALDPARCTMAQARAAHRQSAKRCLEMLREALSPDANKRVPKFARGSWTQDWPAGASMFCYMFSHEAHHRGQVIMLAKQLGYKLPDPAAYGIWHWEKLWKKCGFTTRPR